MKSLWLLLFVNLANSATPVCRSEFEETICENFFMSPELILDSATNKLTIKNGRGRIIHENFSKLEKVTEIIITESEIMNIEPGSLCCNSNLTSITVANNKRFPKITYKTMQACQPVKRLNVYGDVQIDKGAFRDLKNLSSLAFNGTGIGDLEGVFRGLESLKSLSVQYSGCTTLKEKAFSSLKNLKFLDLQNNKIETIEPNAFQNLTQLRVLNLADNKLKNLTWQEFNGLKGLKVLFLERNEFDSVNVDKLVAGVPNLERVFFSFDKLAPESRKKIEETFPKLNITFIYIGKPVV